LRKGIPSISILSILKIHRNVGRSPEAYGILIVNVLILAMVIIFKTDRYIVIAAYFLETLITGIFNVIKMLIISLFSPTRKETPNLTPDVRQKKGDYSPMRMNFFLIVFFILHFSIFYFVQLGLLIGSADMLDKNFLSGGSFLPNPVAFFKEALVDQGFYILAAILLAQLFTLIYSFIIRGEYKVTNCLTQGMQPYGRIILQQFVVLIGSFVIIIIQNAVVFSVMLIIIKTFIDIWAQKRHDTSILKRMEEASASPDN
jgi:hypothetical protein